MNFAAIYGAGAALGFTPRDIDAMSFEEFEACVKGYNKANSPQKPHPRDMSDEDMDLGERLLEEVERRNAARLEKPDGN